MAMPVEGFGQIVHSSPGRLRLRLARPYRTAQSLRQIEDALSGLDGIASVETNQVSGSVLIRYDPVTLPPERLWQLGQTFGLIGADLPAAAGDADVDWRSHVDVPKAARSFVVLAAAVLGGLAAPTLGVSARVGSLSAALATAYLSRVAGRARSAGNGRSPA